MYEMPGQSVPPHVDSDKLRNELHSKEQMYWWLSQKLDTRGRGDNLNATSRVKSNNMYIFALFVFALFYVIQEKHQKILLSFWNKVLFFVF